MRTLWLASASKRGLSLFLVVLALALPMLAQPTGALAQAPADVVWDRYDVTIDVRSDGSMHITEHQVITFNGQFSQGFADIPLSNVEDIENITVSVANGTDEDPVPLDYIRGSSYDADTGTYSYRIESGALAVDYAFDPTDYFDAETRVVVLEYDVIGGLRVYEDLDPANQQVWWYAITSAVTDVAPVTASTVTINLPEDVPVDQTVAYPDNPETDGQSFTWQRSNLGEGDEFEVSLQFPPITTAVEPDWQLRDDEIRQEREEAEERSDLAGLLLLVAGLLTTFGGGIAIFALWFARGRDPQVGLVAEYLPEPPDDLRPGAVGVLLDESFQSRDVVATVLDLARRGVIRMDPVEGKDVTQQYKFVLLDHKETLRQYEQIVLDVIFGSGANAGAEALMPQVAGALAGRNDEIAAGFYQELVDHKYFRESPEATRKRWRRIYKSVPFVIAAVVIAIVAAVGAWSNFAFFPIVIGLVLMLVAGRVSNAMPRKSMAGAESAAKWRAFRNYLRQIDEAEGHRRIEGDLREVPALRGGPRPGGRVGAALRSPRGCHPGLVRRGRSAPWTGPDRHHRQWRPRQPAPGRELDRDPEPAGRIVQWQPGATWRRWRRLRHTRRCRTSAILPAVACKAAATASSTCSATSPRPSPKVRDRVPAVSAAGAGSVDSAAAAAVAADRVAAAAVAADAGDSGKPCTSCKRTVIPHRRSIRRRPCFTWRSSWAWSACWLAASSPSSCSGMSGAAIRPPA